MTLFHSPVPGPPTQAKPLRARAAALAAALSALFALPGIAQGQVNPVIGQIQYFPYACPPNYTLADGRMIDLNQNPEFTQLQQVIGNSFGTNGDNVLLPDLRGRFVEQAFIGEDAREGSDSFASVSGRSNVQVDANNVPAHTHRVLANTQSADSPTPQENTFAVPVPAIEAYTSDMSGTLTTLNAETVAGAGDPGYDIVHPYFNFNACIAYGGEMPDLGGAIREQSVGTNGPDRSPDASGIVARVQAWLDGDAPREPGEQCYSGNTPASGYGAGEYLIFTNLDCPSFTRVANGRSLYTATAMCLDWYIQNIYGPPSHDPSQLYLPDLTRRVPVGIDPANARYAGTQFGQSEISLSDAQLRAHAHFLQASANEPDTGSPDDAFIPSFSENSPVVVYADPVNLLPMNAQILGQTGEAEPIPLKAETIALNYCLVVDGYPIVDNPNP